MEIKGIKYTGPVFDGSGYAQAVRGNIMALHKLGVPLTVNSISFEHLRPELGVVGKVINKLVDKKIDYNINIIHTTPEFWENHKEEGKLNIGYTIWETTKLHHKWPGYINDNVDAIMVGSEWNVGVFKDSGVTVPIFVVPHGIGQHEFDNIEKFEVKGVSDETYMFYSIFQWVERKHPLSLIKAYWHAFQNKEDVALVLKTYRSDYSDQEKEAIRTTIRRLKQVTPFDNYPPIYLIPNMLTNDEIFGLHARGDCYTSLDRGEGFGLCVAQNTNITTPSGIKLAEDIIEGDLTLSMGGKFNKVTATSKRYVEKALRVSIKLHEALVVSHEHPFYVTKDLSTWKRYNYSPSTIEDALEWSEASNIVVGDYVAVPKPKLNNKLIDKIDISDYLDLEGVVVEDEYIFLKHGYSPKNTKNSYKNLVDKYGFTKKIFETAVSHIKNNTVPKIGTSAHNAYTILLKIEYEVKKPNRIKRFIDLDSNLLKLFGWYLAEGSTNNRTFLEIDLHKDEFDVAKSLSDIFKQYFSVSVDSIYTSINGNKSRLIVSSKIIASLFESLFGKGARNKHIPDWLIYSSQSLLPLIKTLFFGDGYDSGNTYALTTVSPSLAYQVKTVLNSLGMCPRINKGKRGELGNYDQYIVSVANEDYKIFTENTITKEYKKHSVETENYFLVKVTNIEEIKYNDYMYDFTINGAESFVGNGILLHNCPFTAGACGNPVIITGFGGITEYAKEDNSYLVDYTLTPVFGMPWSGSPIISIGCIDGYKKIKDVKEGDLVFNKNGKIKSVTKVGDRPMLPDERMHSIKHGSMHTSIEVTNKHKLYIAKNNKSVLAEVEDITDEDYLIIPKPFLYSENFSINMKDYTLTDVWSEEAGRIVYNRDVDVSTGIYSTVELSEDMFYLIGLYLAEGCVYSSNDCVSFSFNSNEIDTLAAECKKCLSSVFGISSEHFHEREYKDRNGYELIVNNTLIGRFFRNEFGTGAHDKFIPYRWRLHTNDNYRIRLLKGYWDGDGHISYRHKNQNAPEYSASSCSENLMLSIRDLVISLDVIPSLTINIRSDGRISYIMTVTDPVFDKLFGVKCKRNKRTSYCYKIDDHHFAVRVKSNVVMKDYKDPVYSLSVEPGDDEDIEHGGSYILNGVASSNSPWYRGSQLWAEVSVKHGADLMYNAYENRQEAKDKGLLLQKYIYKNFEWEVIGQKIVDGIRSL